MASSSITEDYYMVLGVEQSATTELIVRSYRKLALKLHPDRNTSTDATAAFQLLGRAYEILRDDSKRRAYDLIIYPSITGHTQANGLSEEAQLAALQKLKQEREARWLIDRTALHLDVVELRAAVGILKQEIKNVDRVIATEAAENVQSWGTWLVSAIYKKAEISESEKESKDRARQERRIEKDMKERRLEVKRAALKKAEDLFKTAKLEMDAASAFDNLKMRAIRDRIWERGAAKRREESEKILRESERLRKQQQEYWEKVRWAEAAAEARRYQEAQQEARTTAQRRETQEAKRQQDLLDEVRSRACRHDGWWPKVVERRACPECQDVWTYLLQCPSCNIKACPKCQSAYRPWKQRNRARASQARPRSPDIFDADMDW